MDAVDIFSVSFVRHEGSQVFDLIRGETKMDIFPLFLAKMDVKVDIYLCYISYVYKRYTRKLLIIHEDTHILLA